MGPGHHDEIDLVVIRPHIGQPDTAEITDINGREANQYDQSPLFAPCNVCHKTLRIEDGTWWKHQE